MPYNPLTSLSFPHQLSLDLDLDDTAPKDLKNGEVKRSVIFPKNIQIFNVPEFQRQVSQLFDPLNIHIEFRKTRHNRLEMRWLFPREAVHYYQKEARQRSGISREESAAFETLVLSFSSASH
jgi:hypothetical protein